ncbi:MAG TPA: hypothetical protein VF614_01795 [Chthoniobacteraceae bacterium]|jgi:hypothetical protein
MRPLLSTAGVLVERIKINAISKEQRAGRCVWVKRRRRLSRPVMLAANGFFRLAGAPVEALADLRDWREWEVGCFLGLHGDRYVAAVEGPRTVWAEELPGVNLTHHLDTGSLTPRMLTAAALELRRAHEWQCESFSGAWSHGDPHVGNFVYEEAENRARIIDFEVRHCSLSADDRHADDLLVFIQDLAGRLPSEQWVSSAATFLRAYERPEIVSRLLKLLVLPNGAAGLWWKVRTSFLPSRELLRRLNALRTHLLSASEALGQ